MTFDERLGRIADGHPYPLVFASLSGAHLYGFPSPDSEFDRLTAVLEDAGRASSLPEAPSPSSRAALHDLLLRLRGC